MCGGSSSTRPWGLLPVPGRVEPCRPAEFSEVPSVPASKAGSRMHCFSQPKSKKVWKRPPATRVAQLLHLAAKRKLVDFFRSLSGLGTCSLFQLVPNSWGLWGSERMPRAEM